jgi:8-oxo-dGTP diphosphatase
LTPICITSVNVDGRESLGQLFYTEIDELGELASSEIEEVQLFDNIPENSTYPLIAVYYLVEPLNFVMIAKFVS